MNLGYESNRDLKRNESRISDAQEYFKINGKSKTVKYISRKYGYSITASAMIVSKHCNTNYHECICSTPLIYSALATECLRCKGSV